MLSRSKSSQLGSDCVIVEVKSSGPALHHFPSWSDSPYISPGGGSGVMVLFDKQMMVPPSSQPDGTARLCRMLC